MANVTVKYKGSTIAEMNGEGTKTLQTSGKYCEGDIAVSYTPPTPPVVPCKIYDITLSKGSGWVLLTTLDSNVLAHINDPTFTAMLINMSGYVYEWYSGSFYVASNTPHASYNGYLVYGISNRQQNETNSVGSNIFYPANNTGTNTSLGGYGIFRLSGSNYYIMPGDGFIRGGTYRLVFTW